MKTSGTSNIRNEQPSFFPTSMQDLKRYATLENLIKAVAIATFMGGIFYLTKSLNVPNRVRWSVIVISGAASAVFGTLLHLLMKGQHPPRRHTKIAEFYRNHNITKGDELLGQGKLTFTDEDLDFSDYPQSDLLKKMAKEVIAKINEVITDNSSSNESVKSRRAVFIPIAKKSDKIFDGCATHFPSNYEYESSEYNEYLEQIFTRFNAVSLDEIGEIQEQQSFAGIITQKLIDLGLIFALIGYTDQRSYTIQA